jgi:hypothetical protein
VASPVPAAFDLFLKQMGGKIPFPPQKIVDSLIARNITVTAALIPHGRSLERPFTSYEKPRAVVSFDVGDSDALPQRIFLAYTPANEQLQLISSDLSHGQFEFRQVNHYARGKTPQIVTPFARGLCTSCHQTGGPLFTPLPWSETHFNNDVLDRMTAKPGLDPFAKYLLAQNAEQHLELDSQRFQEAVDNANAVHGSQVYCNAICGDDLTCKLALLKGAITQVGSRTGGGIAAPAELLSKSEVARVEQLLKERASLFSAISQKDILNDRSSVNHEHEIAPGSGNDPLIPRRDPDKPFAFPQKLDDSPFPGVTPAQALHQERADNLAVFATSCLPLTESQQIELRNLTPAKIKEAARSPGFKALAEQFPVSPNDAFEEVFQTLKKKAPNQQASEINPIIAVNKKDLLETLARMTESRIGPRSAPHRNTSELFVNHCASCHAGPSSPAPALPLTDLSALKAYKGAAGRTVASMISGPDFLMPPQGASYPSQQDREEMLNAVSDRAPASKPKTKPKPRRSPQAR